MYNHVMVYGLVPPMETFIIDRWSMLLLVRLLRMKFPGSYHVAVSGNKTSFFLEKGRDEESQ